MNRLIAYFLENSIEEYDKIGPMYYLRAVIANINGYMFEKPLNNKTKLQLIFQMLKFCPNGFHKTLVSGCEKDIPFVARCVEEGIPLLKNN